MPKVSEYETEDGRVPFAKWFESLGAKAAAKVTSAIARMGLGNFGDHKSVGQGVWERRIDFEKGYRLYFAKDGDDLVLLFCGGTKVRQQPDIDKARQYWADYKKRKAQARKSKEEAQPSPRRKKKARRKK
jgi:putative addiction module killer protein